MLDHPTRLVRVWPGGRPHPLFVLSVLKLFCPFDEPDNAPPIQALQLLRFKEPLAKGLLPDGGKPLALRQKVEATFTLGTTMAPRAVPDLSSKQELVEPCLPCQIVQK